MRLLLAFFFSLLWLVPGRAQERVRNVRLQVIDESQLEIRYDLIEIHPGDSVYVKMESKQRGELPMLPEYIRGDVGRRVTAGTNRRIVWDAVSNGYALNEDIRATILVRAAPSVRYDQSGSSVPTTAQTPTASPVKPTESTATTGQKLNDLEMPVGSRQPTSQPDQRSESGRQSVDNEQFVTTSDNSIRSRKTRYAGPAWALLSAVAPGMGNVFVQLPKPKIGLRPLLTVGCYGLIVYGLAERQKSRDEYAIYEQQKNMTAGEPYYQTANSHHHNYFLATRGAVVVAAVDVVLTFMRGLRNSRLQKGEQRSKAVTVWPGVQAGQPTAVVHYSF